MPSLLQAVTAACALTGVGGAFAAQHASCRAESGPILTPVIELYTSEGCSSCPPADKWLSALKPAAARGQVVVQAFHVSYWDYIGWVDRFAAPAHTMRQRQLASHNRLSTIYTPQLVRNGLDWRDWRAEGKAVAMAEPARARIALHQVSADRFEAVVTPGEGSGPWAAYWTVTEHGHSSQVKSGENAGEKLQHDFVVRQYVQAGNHRGLSTLSLRAVAPEPGHPRWVNLVVFDPRSDRPLQALSLGC